MTAPARVLAALLALLLWPALASAQTFPKLTGLVVDAANVLPADRKAALETKLEAFQQRTHRQLVVATIADLQGYTREDYGYRLLRAWGPGLRDVNNGAILFIAPNAPVGQRSARIEVGYGLEPVLTDAFSSVVINQVMLPRLKAGDIPGALDAGADAIMQQLSLPEDQAKSRLDAAVKEFDRTHRRTQSGAGVPLGLIFWAMVIAFVFLAHRRRAAGPLSGQRYTGAGSGGSNWPIWLWAASEMMESGRHRDGGGWGGDGGGGLGGWSGGDAGGPDGSWGGGGFTGGGGGSGGGGGASGSW